MSKRVRNSAMADSDRTVARDSRVLSPSPSMSTVGKKQVGSFLQQSTSRGTTKREDRDTYRIKRVSRRSSREESVRTDPKTTSAAATEEKSTRLANKPASLSTRNRLTVQLLKSSQNNTNHVVDRTQIQGRLTSHAQTKSQQLFRFGPTQRSTLEETPTAPVISFHKDLSMLKSTSNLFLKIQASGQAREAQTFEATKPTIKVKTAQTGEKKSNRASMVVNKPQDAPEIGRKPKKPGKLLKLAGFRFEKKVKAKRWGVGSEMAGKIKECCKNYRDVIEEDVFRFNRSLILVTSVRSKQLDIYLDNLQRSNLTDQNGQASPDDHMFTARKALQPEGKRKTSNLTQEVDPNDTSSEEEEPSDLNLNIDYGSRNLLGGAIFQDLGLSVDGHIKFRLLHNQHSDFRYLMQFICRHSLDSVLSKSTLIAACLIKSPLNRLDRSFRPCQLHNHEEFEVIIRRKKNPEFVSTYLKEKQRSPDEGPDPITLWNYDIEALLTEEYGFLKIKDLPDLKPEKVKLNKTTVKNFLFSNRPSIKEPKFLRSRSKSRRDLVNFSKTDHELDEILSKENQNATLIKYQTLLRMVQGSFQENYLFLISEQKKMIEQAYPDVFEKYLHCKDVYPSQSQRPGSSMPQSNTLAPGKREFVGSEIDGESGKKSLSIDKEREAGFKVLHQGTPILLVARHALSQFDSKQFQKSKTKPDDLLQRNSESDLPKIFTYLIPNDNTLRPHKSLPKQTALTPTQNSTRHANSYFQSEAEKKYDSSNTTPKNQTTLPNTNNQALTPTSASTNQVATQFVSSYDEEKVPASRPEDSIESILSKEDLERVRVDEAVQLLGDEADERIPPDGAHLQNEVQELLQRQAPNPDAHSRDDRRHRGRSIPEVEKLPRREQRCTLSVTRQTA